MKILVVHDAQGVIRSLGYPSAGFEKVGIKPKRGECLSILEIAEIEHTGHLASCLKNYRVDSSSDRPRLVKK